MSQNIVPIGVGDGVTSAFTLPQNYKPSYPIYRYDWQGNQLLYPTARTNLSHYATDATNWSLYDCTLGVAITAPNGTANNFYPIIPNTYNVLHYTRVPAAIPANTRITHSFYAKEAGYTLVICETSPLGGDANPTFDLSAGSVSGTGTNTTAAINPVAGQPGVFRCSVTFTTNGSYGFDPSTFIEMYGNFAGDGTSGVYIWGRQTEVGDVATPLIPTTTAPVTVTDYTLNGTTVNLAQAPVSGAILNAQYPDVYDQRVASRSRRGGDAVAITPSDTFQISTTRGLFVAVGGNIAVTTAAGNTLLMVGVPSGETIPIRVNQVLATGTTATGIIGLY